MKTGDVVVLRVSVVTQLAIAAILCTLAVGMVGVTLGYQVGVEYQKSQQEVPECPDKPILKKSIYTKDGVICHYYQDDRFAVGIGGKHSIRKFNNQSKEL